MGKSIMDYREIIFTWLRCLQDLILQQCLIKLLLLIGISASVVTFSLPCLNCATYFPLLSASSPLLLKPIILSLGHAMLISSSVTAHVHPFPRGHFLDLYSFLPIQLCTFSLYGSSLHPFEVSYYFSQCACSIFRSLMTLIFLHVLDI